LKKSLIVIALVVAGVVGVGYYYWQQATFLPNWYSETSADKNSQESVTDASNINRNLNRQKTKGEIQLNQEELNSLIVDNLAKDNRLKQVLPATKAINSDIKDGKLEIGAIVNTSKLSQLNLKESERAIIEQIMQKVPQLQNRDIYVGIQGTPQIKDGKIILGQESQVKVGKLSFTIPEIAQKLNLPAAKLQQDLALDVGQLNLQDIEINQGEIKLKMGTQ
jgi:ribosomal protein S9